MNDIRRGHFERVFHPTRLALCDVSDAHLRAIIVAAEVDAIAALSAAPPADETRGRGKAFLAGMKAAREMPFDSYCARSEPGRPRRSCPECVAKTALEAALDALGGAR